MYRMKRTALMMAQPYIRSMIAVYYCFFSVSLGYGSALTGGPITYMLYIFLLMNIRDRNVRIITLGAIMRLSRDYLSGWSSTRSQSDICGGEDQVDIVFIIDRQSPMRYFNSEFNSSISFQKCIRVYLLIIIQNQDDVIERILSEGIKKQLSLRVKLINKLIIKNLNNNSKIVYEMHRSMNSTEILSKTFSRVKMGDHNSIQSINRSSPQPNTFSSRQKTKSTMDNVLHESLISKNKKLSIMIRTVHSYMLNIEELDWIMKQTQKIMNNYIKNTVEKAGVAHKIQIQNLYNEIVKLISRFSGIDKKWVYQITIPMKEKKFANNNLVGMNMSNIENINMMNFKKTQTIGSFKCMDTQNQQQSINIPTDFSKIKLPAVIKENEIEQNIQTNRQQYNYNNQVKLKQTEAALEITKKQLQNERKQKYIQKQRYQQRIRELNKKIELCHSQWEVYKNYAKNSIKKCKLHLNELLSNESVGLGSLLYTQNDDSQNKTTNRNIYDQYMNQNSSNPTSLIKKKIEDFLDELFIIESKLDRKILDHKLDQIDVEKQEKIKELINLEIEIKKKKAESDRFQTQRVKFTHNNSTGNGVNKTQPNRMFGEESDLARLLYVQATTIQHLL